MNAFTHLSDVKIPVVSDIVPTHIVLLSGDSATFSPSVIPVVLFDNRQHVQMTRRHNFDYRHDVGSVACAMLSARIVTWPARLSHLFKFILRRSTDIISILLSKLNRSEKQKSKSFGD